MAQPGALSAFAVALTLAASALGGARAADEPSPDPRNEPTLLVTYVEGLILPATVDALIADVRTWISKQPRIEFVVFVLDTPGGELQSAERLSTFIFNELKGIRTIAFIPPGRYAYSGGALVAVACREIVMGNDSRMGASTPGTLEGSEFKAADEKMQSVVRSDYRTYATDRGYPTILTDAMVSKDHDDILRVRFTQPDETRFLLRSDYDNLPPELSLRKAGEPQVILRRGEILTMNEKEAREYGFVKHIANDLTELRTALRLPIGDQNVIDTRSGRLRARFPLGQSLVDFFNQPFPRLLLLLLGCLGVLIELKTFGLLFPGATAVACFAIFFITSSLPVSGSLSGTASIPELLLFLVGAGLVALEFLLLPGMAVFAIGGTALCVTSLVLAMVPPGSGGLPEQMTVEDAIATLVYGFGAGSLCFVAVLRFLPHNPLFARKGLVTQTAIVGVPTADSVLAAQATARGLVGKTGKALSALRPAGKMETDDGDLLDVVAEGEFIERGTRVKVRECIDGQIVVDRDRGA